MFPKSHSDKTRLEIRPWSRLATNVLPLRILTRQISCHPSGTNLHLTRASTQPSSDAAAASVVTCHRVCLSVVPPAAAVRCPPVVPAARWPPHAGRPPTAAEPPPGRRAALRVCCPPVVPAARSVSRHLLVRLTDTCHLQRYFDAVRVSHPPRRPSW